MPRFNDAVGYLGELSNEVNEKSFTMLCDLAVTGKTNLTPVDIQTLTALYRGDASYTGLTTPPSPPLPAPTASTDALEELSSFSHFKAIQPTLMLSFPKRLTLIFGTNGSGKSSLCEALKLLGNPDPPARPLQNKRASIPGAPVFSFKFRSDSTTTQWSQAMGFGPRRAAVKYFDTALAFKNTKGAVDPGLVIALTPFKLHIFELVKNLTTQFREQLQKERNENATALNQDVERIRQAFLRFKRSPVAGLTDANIASIKKEISAAEAFEGEADLGRKLAIVAELEKAGSEEGLKLLKAEHRDLEVLTTALTALLDSAETLWRLKAAAKTTDLMAKKSAQEVLAKDLLPSTATVDQLLSLVRASSTICVLENADGLNCPLCKRALAQTEVDLFKKYHELLAGRLEQEIAALKTDLERAARLSESLKAVDPDGWRKCSTLPEETVSEAVTNAKVVASCCTVESTPGETERGAVMELRRMLEESKVHLAEKAKAIEASQKGREELLKQLAAAQSEAEPLEYLRTAKTEIDLLRKADERGGFAQFWAAKLPAFTGLLKRVTEKSKEAYDELIVADFETRLDAEYRALTEKAMSTFGVALARKGGEGSVTVLPQIGGSEIDGVLSEGEQRVHALALFFAELETCGQSVIVFDDPVSSFDYNFIANYCARLRDFAIKHPGRQLIILTHNWEFFVQLQTTLNGGGLNGHLSVQVLENCSSVADYSEKCDELKADIAAILSLPSEPSKHQKEEMAGKMRRLIESVVNTHVFNNQRHQYKQKTQAASDFQQFTKLVPLEPAEALTLKDLYGKLSVTEHDDPRNAYVNTDKAMFQTRYNSLLAVEAHLVSRK